MIQVTVNCSPRFEKEVFGALKGFGIEFMSFAQDGRVYFTFENPSTEIMDWCRDNCILQNEMVIGNKLGKSMTLIAMQYDQIEVDESILID
jgi:hypothetical protein